ncbi:hypothetical protein ACQBAT_04365 [Ornithinimicrobium sp. Y1847]|uniref:hypothetical protein n=1 Tax=unclassified Ornithinimicrobium TaxID=2615080 RepID=UPI003B67A3EB
MTRTDQLTDHRPDDVDRLLARLDPALEDPGPYADLDLDRIVAGHDRENRGGLQGATGRSAHHPHRWWVGAAAAATIGALALSALPGQQSAYAGWTATPAGVPAADLPKLVDDCLENMRSAADDSQTWWTAMPVEEMTTVLAERRGESTLVLLEGQGHLGHCFTDAHRGGSFGFGAAADPSARPAGDSLSLLAWDGGQEGVETDEPSLAPSQITLAGRAGRDVTGIVLHQPGEPGQSVRATLTDGYWAAWWPYALRSDRMPTPAGITADLTLADGRVIEGIDLLSVANIDQELSGWIPTP